MNNLARHTTENGKPVESKQQSQTAGPKDPVPMRDHDWVQKLPTSTASKMRSVLYMRRDRVQSAFSSSSTMCSGDVITSAADRFGTAHRAPRFIARLALAAAIVISAGAGLAHAAERTATARPAKPTIVLVHGAFADATGWQHVIPILQRSGYTVVAVQNSLSSFADDVRTTSRLIDAQTGPVVAVGHSYGGAVITGAAAGSANVKALLYIAAFAPDANEAIGAFGEKYPSALGSALRADSAGFLTIDPARFRDLFAKDVSPTEANIMAVAQKPIFGDSFSASVPDPAWKTIQSWYLVTREDGALNPDLQRFYAKRMGAKTTEIHSSHVPFVSHPRDVARWIDEAARAVAEHPGTR